MMRLLHEQRPWALSPLLHQSHWARLGRKGDTMTGQCDVAAAECFCSSLRAAKTPCVSDPT